MLLSNGDVRKCGFIAILAMVITSSLIMAILPTQSNDEFGEFLLFLIMSMLMFGISLFVYCLLGSFATKIFKNIQKKHHWKIMLILFAGLIVELLFVVNGVDANSAHFNIVLGFPFFQMYLLPVSFILGAMTSMIKIGSLSTIEMGYLINIIVITGIILFSLSTGYNSDSFIVHLILSTIPVGLVSYFITRKIIILSKKNIIENIE